MKRTFEAKLLPYNLRCSEKRQLPKAKTTGLEIDTVRYVGGRVWETLPPELKTSSSLKISKGMLKSTNVMPAAADYVNIFIPI